ncbi:hypothetical protein Bbelb_382850 [Branchiostoma belcheri]|nr:hypothetical protein Bbelb_382850 [Branchiostoma belcheri]
MREQSGYLSEVGGTAVWKKSRFINDVALCVGPNVNSQFNTFNAMLPEATICRVIALHNAGVGPCAIERVLKEEGLRGCRQTVTKMLRRLHPYGVNVYPRPGRCGIAKLQIMHLNFINDAIEEADSDASELQTMLRERFGISVHESTIKRQCYAMGWVKNKRNVQHQLLSEETREERMAWCQKMVLQNERFDDVIFTDDTEISLDNNANVWFRKRWDKVQEADKDCRNPRLKHPTKDCVKVWAGISKRGPTPFVAFTYELDAVFFCNEILLDTLRPYLFRDFPKGHRLQQDTDAMRTSRFSTDIMEAANIFWWKTPASSPDLNPMEHVWHEMRQYLRKVAKPRTQDELVQGIQQFWSDRMTPGKCCRYIDHLHKVMPVVITRVGYPSGDASYAGSDGFTTKGELGGETSLPAKPPLCGSTRVAH